MTTQMAERPFPLNGELARGVEVIALNGVRDNFDSVASAARTFQLSKDRVRKACKAGSYISGVWFKFDTDRDPAGAPSRPESKREAYWNVVCIPVEGRPELFDVHCRLFGMPAVTTIDIDSGALNCRTLCESAGKSFC